MKKKVTFFCHNFIIIFKEYCVKIVSGLHSEAFLAANMWDFSSADTLTLVVSRPERDAEEFLKPPPRRNYGSRSSSHLLVLQMQLLGQRSYGSKSDTAVTPLYCHLS